MKLFSNQGVSNYDAVLKSGAASQRRDGVSHISGLDAYGNLLSDGTTTYTYDAALRLKTVTTGGSTTTYQYNGDGDRVAQTVNGVQTTYVIDTATPLTMVLAETTGTDTIRTLHGLDLVAQSDGTSTEYFAYDGLGSVRQVLGESGLPLMAQTFDPYGNPYRYAGPTESVASYGYSGEQTDSNGLVFLRARYYDPKQGRFFQRDTWKGNSRYPQTLNPYVYGMGNPISYTDPSGRCIFGIDTVICIVVGAMAVGAIIGGAIAYGMYRLALSGACGCELQQEVASKSAGEVIASVLGTAAIAAVATPISLAIPDEVLIAASMLAAGASFQQIEQLPQNACAWTTFVLLTLPAALKTAGLLRASTSTAAATRNTGAVPSVSRSIAVRSGSIDVAEFDVINMAERTFIENKSGTGLLNPMNRQTPAQWANRQIFLAAETKIQGLSSGTGTGPGPQYIGGPIPTIGEIRGFRRIVFNIEADFPALRTAVDAVIIQLESIFSKDGWEFIVRYGAPPE